MTQVALSNTGVLSLATVVGSSFGIDYQLESFLGDDAVLDVAFFGTKAVPVTLSDITARLTWRDAVTDDIVYRVQGTLNNDEDDNSSLLSIAYAQEIFSNFDLSFGLTALADIQLSTAFNASNGLGRNKGTLTLPADNPPVIDGDTLYQLLTTLTKKPAYLVLPRHDDLTVYNAVYRAADKLNIPLDVEIDPTLTVDQAAQFTTTLEADDHRVQFIWSPNLCRPRDAISLRGRKTPAYAMGEYLGKKLLRNARTNAQGLAPINEPVAGERYPFGMKGLVKRQDVILDDSDLEKLAKAKINVIRSIQFDTGVKFVLSDVLTQKISANGALRLVNAAEIACQTVNRCIEILRRHMLRGMTSYITDASRDIDAFLSACSSPTAGWLKPAKDLGGKPYQFSLNPDETYPFERVRFYLARRPEGAVRAVIFDGDVITK